MGESNTVVSAYTLYRHLKKYYRYLQNYCSHPSIYSVQMLSVDEKRCLRIVALGEKGGPNPNSEG